MKKKYVIGYEYPDCEDCPIWYLTSLCSGLRNLHPDWRWTTNGSREGNGKDLIGIILDFESFEKAKEFYSKYVESRKLNNPFIEDMDTGEKVSLEEKE